jgi:hypothetical protein
MDDLPAERAPHGHAVFWGWWAVGVREWPAVRLLAALVFRFRKLIVPVPIDFPSQG